MPVKVYSRQSAVFFRRYDKNGTFVILFGYPFSWNGFAVQMDVSYSGNLYALVFQDYLTKWPEVYPVPDRSAPTVASV